MNQESNLKVELVPKFVIELVNDNAFTFISAALKRITSSMFNLLVSLIFIVLLTLSDLFITFFNLLIPSRDLHETVPKPFSAEEPPSVFEHPFIYLLCKLANLYDPHQKPEWIKFWSTWDGIDHDGNWGEVKVGKLKKENYSRSPCPAINALANHGIIKRSGRNLSFHEIASAISRTYNLSPTLAIQLLASSYPIFKGRTGIDLSDLSAHGLIEHDGSLLRSDVNSPDYEFIPDNQSYPCTNLINRFFPDSPHPMTFMELSNSLALRRAECEARNGTFYRHVLSDLFGSGNCGLMLEVTDGNRKVIRAWFGIHGHEHFQPRWKPANRQAFGTSILRAQILMFRIELGTGWNGAERHL
ncbi:hypothetical protein CROQUDRAFT_726489 [Cronartium quercuum f. sp. fusiforme G11]|uniref:Heme haloperoxidase family profile domain-containing protein n=1 Tax=Cronartium quercuum f. sp. fusiforme G11 TaxID=708437 RepID=A0A9P6N5J1_9BASI|nr:hypothetical protein CROQUDRAFT_726489 [Cronartium quercuum f. sp. fusiforme G11]